MLVTVDYLFWSGVVRVLSFRSVLLLSILWFHQSLRDGTHSGIVIWLVSFQNEWFLLQEERWVLSLWSLHCRLLKVLVPHFFHWRHKGRSSTRKDVSLQAAKLTEHQGLHNSTLCYIYSILKPWLIINTLSRRCSWSSVPIAGSCGGSGWGGAGSDSIPAR